MYILGYLTVLFYESWIQATATGSSQQQLELHIQKGFALMFLIKSDHDSLQIGIFHCLIPVKPLYDSFIVKACLKPIVSNKTREFYGFR